MTDNTNRRASPKESEVLELPPLPEGWETRTKFRPGGYCDTSDAMENMQVEIKAWRAIADQMQQYAREAVASLKAASDAAIALAGETIAARNAEIAELREAVEADRRARAVAHISEMAQWARDNGLNVPVEWSSRAQQPAPAASIGDDAKLAEARRETGQQEGS